MRCSAAVQNHDESPKAQQQSDHSLAPMIWKWERLQLGPRGWNTPKSRAFCWQVASAAEAAGLPTGRMRLEYKLYLQMGDFIGK